MTPGSGEGTIDEDAVAAYALATNDPNPRYLHGEAIPPLFTATMALTRKSFDSLGVPADVIVDAKGGVHGQHDVHFFGPARPNMDVRWNTSVYGVRENRGGVLLTPLVEFTDAEGNPLVRHYWSSYYIGARANPEMGEMVPDHTFPEEARDRPFADGVVHVDRDQAFRYAGVSDDHAPHALNDARARQEGYPGKILQGMCTFGLAAGVVVNLVADGDPDRLRRLAVRFSAPGRPKRDLRVRVYDAGRTEQGCRVFVFEADQDGTMVLKHGRVELSTD